MASTVTLTGVTGPGITMTAQVFTNVSSWGVINSSGVGTQEVFFLNFSDGKPTLYVSIAAATTMTVTISGANYTVTVS